MEQRTLGDRIRELRTLRGMTQNEVASRTGIYNQTLCHYEKDHWKRIPAWFVLKLCEVLDVTPNVLFGFDEMEETHGR